MTTSTTECEQALFDELIEHYATRRPDATAQPDNHYDLGRHDGYAAGLAIAIAIHHLTGEPIDAIYEQAHDGATDLRHARHEQSLP